MSGHTEAKIAELEEKLRLAMLASDVDVLNTLIDDDLIFTAHTGEVLGKSDDVGAHRSGAVDITVLEPSNCKIVIKGETAVVSVRMAVSGSFNGFSASGDFIYTRIWHCGEEGAWRIIAGHATMLN